MFEAQIQLGINWLNEHAGPTWYRDINLDELDMENGYHCILGQLAGTMLASRGNTGYDNCYSSVCDVFGLDMNDRDESDDVGQIYAEDLGFVLNKEYESTIDHPYQVLAEEWAEEIDRLLESKEKS